MTIATNATATAGADLSSRAMLVSLSITAWTARKLDKRVTNKVLADNHAPADAGRFNKTLIADELLKKITQIDNECRAEHYRLTLPWSNDGARILPAKLFFDYREKMTAFRQQRETAVREFVDAYPELVRDARIRLNGLFNEADYPSAGRVAGRFTFNASYGPLPTGDDFRVNLSDDELGRIRNDIDRQTRSAMADGMRDAWQRLYDVVRHAAERLSDPDAIFRDTLIGNIRDICGLLPALNVTDDPQLETARQAVESALAGADPDTLRTNKPARQQTATAARAIADSIQQQLGAMNAQASAAAAFA